MVFEKIDRSSWKRNEYFEYYFTKIPCTYSMTVKLDITQIKKKRMRIVAANTPFAKNSAGRRRCLFGQSNSKIGQQGRFASVAAYIWL